MFLKIITFRDIEAITTKGFIMNQNWKSITLQDVANDAGVSKTTASLVVRGSQSISDATTRKVLESIERLGYVYDRAAANLRSRNSSSVGIIISDITNPFFAELLAGANDQLDEYGYAILLGITYESKTKQDQLIDTMLENRVGGLILFPVANTPPHTIKKLQNLNIPVVLVGRDLRGANIDYVGVENKLAAKIATQLLIKSGHNRIAFLGGIPNTLTYLDRLAGYKGTLKDNGLNIDKSLIITGPQSRYGGHIVISNLLKLPDPPRAILCYNDIVALGAMERLHSVGLVPGKDVAVVGFDNIHEAALSRPKLTTVAADIRQAGKESAKVLYKRSLCLDAALIRVILSPQIIVRESSITAMQVEQ